MRFVPANFKQNENTINPSKPAPPMAAPAAIAAMFVISGSETSIPAAKGFVEVEGLTTVLAGMFVVVI